MSDPQPPAEDMEVLDRTARIALDTYAHNGTFPPFLTIDSGGDLFIVPSQGLSNVDQKRRFVEIARFLSIEREGRRSAFAMESWTLKTRTQESMRLLEEIYARGGSMSEHPDAGEAIVLIGESDAGRTMRQHHIVRNGETISLGQAEVHFTPIAEMGMQGGIFSDFHVPTSLQTCREAQAFADTMRQTVGVHAQKAESEGTGRSMN